VTNGPLNLLFNQNYLPGTNTSDVPLFITSTSNSVVLTTGGSPPLIPGETYYLGVQNPGTNTASFSIQVDFNIITLTNGIPFTNTAPVNSVQYYQYFVSTNNPVATAFEILNPNGNVILVASEGAPLPDLGPGDYNYISDYPGSNNQAIVVLTNSSPVALAPGQWYLGVFNNDTNTVNYRIRALESDGPAYPNIIMLTNGVPVNFNSGPGVALTNFFEFDIGLTNTNSAALFELYNLSGNADLTLQYDRLPYNPPFFDGSFRPGTTPEQIVIRSNILGTNFFGQWFLGVPNNDPNVVTYTIRAVLSTNGILVPYYTNTTIVITPPGSGSTNGPTLTWASVTGETYWVEENTNLLITNGWVTISTNVAAGTTTIFATPTNSPPVPQMFYRVLQEPGP